jgi:hypothetical protein
MRIVSPCRPTLPIVPMLPDAHQRFPRNSASRSSRRTVCWRCTTKSSACSGSGLTPRSLTPAAKATSKPCFGWRRLVPDGKGMGYMERHELRRSLQNFPTQSNGGEMVWRAVVLATEDGLLVSATVHDACVPLPPCRNGQKLPGTCGHSWMRHRASF